MRAHPLIAFALLGLACSRPALKDWDQDGIKVLATETHPSDEDYGDLRIEVTDGTQRFCYGSGAHGSARERHASFQAVIAKDGYLFVPASCGGGNASKCQGFEAFATKPKLRWLGHVTGRWDGQAVVVYADGVFYDTGDMLESNDLLSHYESPRYTTAYTEHGRLRFEADKTWDLNAEAYAQATDDAAGLLFQAGLAKLCGRNAELKKARTRAKALLDAHSYPLFEKSLLRVRPQGLQPNPFIPVGQCPPTEKP